MPTIAEWLERRTPPPPDALAVRLRIAFGDDGLAADAGEFPDRALAASERIVRALLAGDERARESAFDLLAADALVTYACEYFADDPETAEAVSRIAMARLAELGNTAAA